MKMPWVISRKLLYMGFFVVISAALATFSLFLYDRYSKVQDLDRYTLYQYEVVRQTRVILSDMVDMETGVRGYVLTGDRKFLDPYYGADFRLHDEIIHLRNSTYSEQHSFAETNTWLDQIVGLQKQLKAQIDAVDVNGRGAVKLKDIEAQRQTMARLRTVMDASMNNRLRDLQDKTRAVEAHKNDFLFTLLMGSVLSIGMLLLGTVVIIRLEFANEKSEEERKRAEQRFRTVMDGVNDGLWEYNFVKENLYASKEFKAMLGYDDDELPSTMEAVTSRIHPDDVQKTIEHRRAYAAREIPVYNSVFRMKHKDGTWRWVMSRGVGLWDRHGEIRTLTGTHTDITEQKNREEELRQLHADMEAFTYITSHDMRSPLVNLKGFSHELRLTVSELDGLLEPQKKKLGDETWTKVETFLRHDIPEALGFIGNAVDRMDTLTTAILDLSRIGKYVYRDETVDSRAIVDKCLGAQSYEIGNKKVDVIVGDLPRLVTDPVALEQIFSNLIDNAVKYLKPDRPGRIEIQCFASNRDHIFSIRDNGRGIEAEDSQKVFHIFRRARNTGDVRGLGLGMAFVKATLRKLGGSIWFDSTLDSGTTFYISLPKKQPARVKPTPDDEAAGPGTDNAMTSNTGAKTALEKSKSKGIAV